MAVKAGWRPGRWRWALLALAAFLAGGCENRGRVLLPFRDSPYLAEFASQGEEACRRQAAGFYGDDRLLALRTLAQFAAAARERGEARHASELTEFILERLRRERAGEARQAALELCGPFVAADAHGQAFLRGQLAEGQVCAARALAAGRPADGFDLLEPLCEHPSPAVRYEGALALTILGDGRGQAAVLRVLDEMNGEGWPKTVKGLPLALARQVLRARAEYAFAGLPESRDEFKLPPVAPPVLTPVP